MQLGPNPASTAAARAAFDAEGGMCSSERRTRAVIGSSCRAKAGWLAMPTRTPRCRPTLAPPRDCAGSRASATERRGGGGQQLRGLGRGARMATRAPAGLTRTCGGCSRCGLLERGPRLAGPSAAGGGGARARGAGTAPPRARAPLLRGCACGGGSARLARCLPGCGARRSKSVVGQQPRDGEGEGDGGGGGGDDDRPRACLACTCVRTAASLSPSPPAADSTAAVAALRADKGDQALTPAPRLPSVAIPRIRALRRACAASALFQRPLAVHICPCGCYGWKHCQVHGVSGETTLPSPAAAVEVARPVPECRRVIGRRRRRRHRCKAQIHRHGHEYFQTSR
eukprot:scaffold1202_cov384-Prasinococcus_capsulatus_cf.AAC.9